LRFFILFLIFASFIKLAFADDLKPLPERPHLLVDANTGEVISAEQPFKRWAPASLTKLMTSYTVLKTLELQHLAMNSPVRISEAALAQPPSKMGFPIGTILTVEAALKIIMVKSANDISVALGEAIAGSEERFVQLMNSHARRLGMKDSNFVNTHGLHDPFQFTTARDMVILTQAIIREFPQHEALYSIPALRVGNRRLRNHNALLERFPGTIGMKTGYVCASGFNVVVRTKRDEREIISVVLGGKSGLARNVRAARLLTEAFSGELKGTDITFADWEKPEEVSDQPEDITNELCPGKYAHTAYNAFPDKRPADAPKEPEATIVDIALNEDEIAKVETREPIIASPTPSPSPPDLTEAKVEDVEEVKEVKKETVLEDKPPSLAELAEIYMTPRQKIGEDVRVTLGGGVGPNPNGIKHTDGGPYVAPTPVPTKKPALDLQASSE